MAGVVATSEGVEHSCVFSELEQKLPKRARAWHGDGLALLELAPIPEPAAPPALATPAQPSGVDITRLSAEHERLVGGAAAWSVNVGDAAAAARPAPQVAGTGDIANHWHRFDAGDAQTSRID